LTPFQSEMGGFQIPTRGVLESEFEFRASRMVLNSVHNRKSRVGLEFRFTVGLGLGPFYSTGSRSQVADGRLIGSRLQGAAAGLRMYAVNKNKQQICMRRNKRKKNFKNKGRHHQEQAKKRKAKESAVNERKTFKT
jgi:hypothetical protein